MKRVTVPLLVAAAALVPGPAEAGKRRGPLTFAGSCAFSGSVAFHPPLTGVPQDGRGFATARGTCTGTLTGRRGRVRRLRNARAGYVAWNRGLVSCQQGSATGGGYLKLRGRKLRFRLTETRAAAIAALQLEGIRGGSAEGTASVSQEEDPAEIAQACAGPGLRESKVDIDLQTSPALSG